MKSIINFINEYETNADTYSATDGIYSMPMNTVSDKLDIMDDVYRLLDLNQKGKKLYRKGPYDEETDKLFTKMSMPEYQLTVCLTSKARKLKGVKIIAKGKVYSVIQF